MENIDRRGEHGYLWQHDIQSSGRKVILNRQAHELRDTDPLLDCLDQRLSIVAIEGASGNDPRAIGKSKRLWPAGKQMAKTSMLLEIIDRPGDSPALETLPDSALSR